MHPSSFVVTWDGCLFIFFDRRIFLLYFWKYEVNDNLKTTLEVYLECCKIYLIENNRKLKQEFLFTGDTYWSSFTHKEKSVHWPPTNNK